MNGTAPKRRQSLLIRSDYIGSAQVPCPSTHLKCFQGALTATLPIAAGFLFIGAAYGFYMQRMGFSFWYPMLMAMIIFGGSLEFVTVTMLLSPFAPLQAFLMALMIQARHLFYGIACWTAIKEWVGKTVSDLRHV